MDILYGLDIETDTSIDGLDPESSPIVAVALSGPQGDEVFEGPEPQLLAAVDARLADLPAGVVTTWNGARFDLPFLARRAELCGVVLGLRLVPKEVPRWQQLRRAAEREAAASDGREFSEPVLGVGHTATWHHHSHLDGYQLFRADVGRQLGISCALKNLARMVGLDVVQVDRTAIHKLAPAELHSYVASDARLTRLLVARRGAMALASVDRPAPLHNQAHVTAPATTTDAVVTHPR
jgi:uncharacterized protein YprB with RNaseH-like and TPR domain